MKCDKLIDKIKQADADYKQKGVPIHLDIQIEDLLDAFAELKDMLRHYPMMTALLESDKKQLRCMEHSLWIRTAEWAEAMGLASCNIAAKFMSRENFEVGDAYRKKTIEKHRHRQVVFYKYADYCRKKAEVYK